jgi:hypothetical protein
LIVFAAGTYNILAPITIPCGVTITGPVASPATAILAAAYTGKVSALPWIALNAS